MRPIPIFVKPMDSLGLPASRMEMLQRLPFTAAKKENLELISTYMELFETYRQLPLGMSASLRQQFKAKLNTGQDMSAMRQLMCELGDRARRYAWNLKAVDLLDQEEFWSGYGNTLSKEKVFWDSVSPYAHYTSDDLRFISEKVLPSIHDYCEHATREFFKKNTPKNAGFLAHLEAFNNYVVGLKAAVEKEHQRIAQAMVARLELAASHKDLAYDDVLFYVSEQLNKKEVDLSQPFGQRSYNTPRRGLNSAGFHYFHRTIMQHGSEEVQERCQALGWVKDKSYVYDKTKRRWSTAPNLIAGAVVPPSRWWPKRLFRGRNARYSAFHNVTRTVRARFSAQRAETLQRRFELSSAPVPTTEACASWREDFFTIQKEHDRITRLRGTLTRVIHWKTRDTLKVYSDELVQHAEKVVIAQLNALDKAIKNVPTMMDQNDLLDALLTLADQLQAEAAFFPAEHTTVIHTQSQATQPTSTWIHQKAQALRDTIATQKINGFALALHHNTVETHAVYNKSGQLIYRLPDAPSVARHCASFMRYLSPDQVTAMQCIQRAMQGDYLHAGEALRYNDLHKAASALTENPEDILIPLYHRFIAPSIVAENTTGYSLLRAFEQALGDAVRNRSALLQAVKEDEKISLFTALENVFKDNTDLNAVSEAVTVDNEKLSVEHFRSRLSVLELQAIEAIINPYLQTYSGEDENLWPVFSALPRTSALDYGHRRLVHLLQGDGDIDRVLESPCLRYLEPLLKLSNSVQATLLAFLHTVPLTDEKLEQIDALVARFSDEENRTLWCHRREQYLIERVKSVIMGNDVGTAQLHAYITDHPHWLTSEATQQHLLTVFQKFSLDGWTDAQHALLNAVEDVVLRQTYTTRLLQRILSDSTFAAQHRQHLPGEDNIIALFNLMGAPAFRSVCEEAIHRLHQQDRIDNVDAIRTLDSLLHHGVAVTLELEDLTETVDRLRIKFKDQLEVENLAKEVIALMDGGDRDKAFDKIQRLRKTYDYYRSVNNEKEQGRVVETLQTIFSAIEKRRRLPMTDEKMLLPNEALKLVEPLDCLDNTEPLLWELNHDAQLLTIVLTLQTEILALVNEEATSIPSLKVFFEAIQREALTLTEPENQDILLKLRAVKAHNRFVSLPATSQQLVRKLLEHFQGEASETDDIAILNEAKEALPIDTEQKASNDNVVPTDDNVEQALLSPSMAKTKVVQQVIEEIQKDETLNLSLDLLRKALTSDDLSQKAGVEQDLLCYFREAYHRCSDKDVVKSLRMSARKQLSSLHYLVDKLGLKSDDPLALLVRSYRRSMKHFMAFNLSLKAIIEEAQQELPELNQLVVLYVERNILDTEIRQNWIACISENLLPLIAQTPSCVSTQLASALPSFLKLLEGKGTEEDQQNLVAYENYYRDVVLGGVQQTEKARLMSTSPQSQAISKKDDIEKACAL